MYERKDEQIGEKMKFDQIDCEIYIESEKIFYQLMKNIETETIENSSNLYLLREKDFDENVCRLSSKYLEETMPKLCKIEECKRVVVESFYNGHYGYWMFSPILGKVADKSGFASVERWLDYWSKTQGDFEHNKKYFLWLIKIKYPVQESLSNS